MEYEIINPSDPYRMTADRLDTAAVAICLLGDGKYAAKPRSDGEEVPMFLFTSPDPWFVERFGMNYADTANKIIEHRNEELAAVFDSVTLERTERSSLNDIGGRAKALAQAVRRKINEAAERPSSADRESERSEL